MGEHPATLDPLGTFTVTRNHESTKDVFVKVQDENEPPKFAEDDVTVTVAEHHERQLPMPRKAIMDSPMAMDQDDDERDIETARTTGNVNANLDPDVEGPPYALTYKLEGADAGSFEIVPATGELWTRDPLDYETKRTYNVIVKATDPTGMSDTIGVKIEVTDVDEQPAPGPGQNLAPVFGEDTPVRMVAEKTEADQDIGAPILAQDPNDDIVRYTATGNQFAIDPDTGQLMTKGALNYETVSTYSVTVMATDNDATDPLSSETTVTVMVTDVIELGALSGSTSASINEGDTDLGTYTLTEIEDGPMATWSKEGVDADQFTLNGTGMSRMLKFSSAPDYESPMGGGRERLQHLHGHRRGQGRRAK